MCHFLNSFLRRSRDEQIIQKTQVRSSNNRRLIEKGVEMEFHARSCSHELPTAQFLVPSPRIVLFNAQHNGSVIKKISCSFLDKILNK